MFGLAIKGRRKELDRTLREDISQPAGWEPWLAAAKSIDDLHASCTQPGWLVYCAYWAKVPQDKLLDGALALGELACKHHPKPPIPIATMKRLRDMNYPDLAALMHDLMQAHPVADMLFETLPTQVNPLLIDLGSLRMRDALDALEADEPLDLGPYRADPSALSGDETAPLVAAGYVFTIETVFHRAQGLREALAIRGAAAASLLRMTSPEFQPAAVALLRSTYGWT